MAAIVVGGGRDGCTRAFQFFLVDDIISGAGTAKHTTLPGVNSVFGATGRAVRSACNPPHVCLLLLEARA